MKTDTLITGRQLLATFVVAAFCAILSSCVGIQESRTANLNGEVFIVTQGARNIKLGSVEVKAIPAEAFYAALQERKGEISKAIQDRYARASNCNDEVSAVREGRTPRGDVSSIMERCLAAFREYEAIPLLLVNPVSSNAKASTTNSEGKFSFKLEKGQKYVVVAFAKRIVGNEEEHYYWLKDVDFGSDDAIVILSNKELMNAEIVRLTYGN
jgi:hypothetical protein